MSKLLITAIKTTAPNKPATTDTQVVYVESDKILIFPRDSATESTILANGYQFDVLAEVSELSQAIGGEDVSAYT